MADTRSYPSGVRNFSVAIGENKSQPVFNYIYDASSVYTTPQGYIQTGSWRALKPADLSSTLNASGLSISINSVAITGNPSVQISNIPTVQVQNTVYQVGITGQPLFVTGNFGSSSSSSSVVLTGINNVFIGYTGGPLIGVSGAFTTTVGNIHETGVVFSLISYTGGPLIGISGSFISAPTPIQAISGLITVTNPSISTLITGSNIQLSVNAILTGTNSVSINNIPIVLISGNSLNVHETGQPTIIIGNSSTNPVPVSGIITLTGQMTTVDAATFYGLFVTGFASGQIQIPTGVLSYAISVESGSSFVNGIQINSPMSIGGGGYRGVTYLRTPINVGVTGGRVVITYEN